jgi:alpha,alpha-trehalase
MDTWSLRYRGYEPSEEGLREALCTVGNGYFATRGAAPESRADKTHYPGTYIAGCYNRLESDVDNHRIVSESVVNAPNWLSLKFRIGEEGEEGEEGGGRWFDLRHADVLRYEQALDLRRGVLTRRFRFGDGEGRITSVLQRRFAHMGFAHLGGIESTVTADNWRGRVTFISALDGRVTNSGVPRYRQLDGRHLVPEEGEAVLSEHEDSMYLLVSTSQSKIRIAEAARTSVWLGGREVHPERCALVRKGYVGQEFSVTLGEGRSSVSVQKTCAIFTSRDFGISECGYASRRAVVNAPSFSDLLEQQGLSWDRLWRRLDTSLEGDDRTALAVHLHSFHIFQTVSPNTIGLDVGLPPRGLHGEAYRGHILWDEIFTFPIINLHIPDLTRSLLIYRYRRLPEARLAARQAGYGGALFPWQSGSDGREESQRIHLNPVSSRWVPDDSHLQRHVNAAIAFNVWSYFQVTQDIDFLAFYGAEMMIEVARFFESAARYNRRTGRYEIHGVMGPDEFHDSYPHASRPGLNNNAYTNVMVAWVFCRTLDALEALPEGRRGALRETLGLREEEVRRWEQMSRRMFVPFLLVSNGDGGAVISQFQGYEKLKELDWEGYRKKYKNIQRLDRILEAENDSPNNYRLSKQADVLMLFYLLPYRELKALFDRLGYSLKPQDVKKNIEFYMKRTSHGSTLSRVVHAWALARIDSEESWRLERDALESDISDIQGGTTAEGIHIGAMAGTLEVLQRCYTGLVTRDGVLWLDPCLPQEVKRLAFAIYYHRHVLDLELTQEALRISSRPGEEGGGAFPINPVRIGFRGEVFEMRPGEAETFQIHVESGSRQVDTATTTTATAATSAAAPPAAVSTTRAAPTRELVDRQEGSASRSIADADFE